MQEELALHTADDGQPYLSSEMRSTDGRAAKVYWLIIGRRLVNLVVITSAGLSSDWSRVAAQIPFSVKPTEPTT